ncbi:MAG: YicC family protein [Phycisphaerales bacterium]|nr:YicC family protein [Phycisphaerales bacterium]
MTGFGSASTEVGGSHYVVEIRSLNNRYLKVQVRLPEELQGLEGELESLVSKRLTRGSIVVTVRLADNSAEAAAKINVRAVERYLDQLLAVPRIDHDSTRVDLGTLLSLPGVIVVDTGEDRLARAREALLGLAGEACDHLLVMRTREGGDLQAELHRHCDVIADRLEFITEHAPRVVTLYQDRLRQRMNMLLSEIGSEARDEDLLREVATFAERADIAEEISRLGGHLDHFRSIIDSDADDPAGRTLDFITQEMLREANTMGSKCLDGDIARRTVEIKGAIDRIKEQVQNVE